MADEPQRKYPEPCEFVVPISLKVPIYLDLEVKAKPPACYPYDGNKPDNGNELALAPKPPVQVPATTP